VRLYAILTCFNYNHFKYHTWVSCPTKDFFPLAHRRLQTFQCIACRPHAIPSMATINMFLRFVSVCVLCVYFHIVARSISGNVVLQGCGKLQGVIFSERELFAICRHPSVCRLSVGHLSSVYNVYTPYSGD